MIFKIFLPKNLTKKIGVFLLKLLLVFAKIVIITLVFEKNGNFFAENKQKPQKIVIVCNIDPWWIFFDWLSQFVFKYLQSIVK
jgi:hypothetical protein